MLNAVKCTIATLFFLALVPFRGESALQDADDVAVRASVGTAPAPRPLAGRQPLRRLFANCSRTRVCDQLPRGWTRLLDPVSGCDYYWNAFTQSSTWDAPVCSSKRPPDALAPPPSPPSLPAPVPAPASALPASNAQTTTVGVATTVPDPTPSTASLATAALASNTSQNVMLGRNATTVLATMPAPAIVPGDGPARVDMLVLSGVLGITIGDVVWLHALKLLGARRLILVDSVKPFVGTDSQKYCAW
jgi:hypothetical protein